MSQTFVQSCTELNTENIVLYLFHYKRIPNHFRGSVSGILSQNIHGGVGCPTISQVWDIQNYFYSWRFGGISDEIFIKTKEKY